MQCPLWRGYTFGAVVDVAMCGYTFPRRRWGCDDTCLFFQCCLAPLPCGALNFELGLCRYIYLLLPFIAPVASSQVVLVCILTWLHGATFGAIIGDGFSVFVPLLVLTVVMFVPIISLWMLPNARRLVVAILYFLIACYLMCMVSSLTWFRNPSHLPPLPDILHDVLPEIPYIPFFPNTDPHTLPDFIILPLLAATVIFIVQHKQRWTILRRFLVLSFLWGGTCFYFLWLLRCFLSLLCAVVCAVVSITHTHFVCLFDVPESSLPQTTSHPFQHTPGDLWDIDVDAKLDNRRHQPARCVAQMP